MFPHFPPVRQRGARPLAQPRPPRRDGQREVAQLRLAIGRNGVGIELGAPARVGCLDVLELQLRIPHVRFPLDVSGGVSRFRHRRGELERLVVELGARDFERWAAPLLRGLLGPNVPAVWVTPRKAGATVAVLDKDERSSPCVLAFEVALDAEGDDLRVFVTQARGTGLPAPATALAMRGVLALLGREARRDGATFTIPRAARALACAMLPEAGVRAPAASTMRWTTFAAHEDRWIAIGTDDGAPAEATEDATRARELCTLTREADDVRFDGDLDRARALDVAALERAPRHPEISRRIAEIDRLAGGRAEAALAVLAQAAREPDAREGLLTADLLAEIRDTPAAIAALGRVGETEPVPALAACAFARAAELTPDPLDALVWLDLALARSSLGHVRWARLARRLAAGRLEDALADAEHLEAEARGGGARYAVWRRAGDAWVSAGLRSEAAPLFERALRFEPNDPHAVAGLGAALVSAGRAARGAALLTHAIEISEALGQSTARTAIDLARALAGPLDDRPSALARVHAIPNDAPEAVEARGLEGRWRAELGDLAGASLAFARLRDLASSRVSPNTEAHGGLVVELLVEAAAFERDRRGDLLATQRLLACALRLAPHHAAVAHAYRDVGLAIVGRAAEASRDAEDSDRDLGADEGPEAQPALRRGLDLTERPSSDRVAIDLGLVSTASSSEYDPDYDEATDAARVDQLTRLLQADPTQDAIVDELAQRLTRLGRTHELLALLSARMDDASPERRRELIPSQRAVLERLERDARDAGRDVEAAFLREAIAMLSLP